MVGIHSFCIQGPTCLSSLASRIGALSATSPLDVLVLMSLDINHQSIIDTVFQNNNKKEDDQTCVIPENCSVFITETYGILGYDEELKQNVELMEQGRGSEYGYVGGSGGQGIVVVGYSGGDYIAGSGASIDDDNIPTDATNLLVIADGSGEWKKKQATGVPIHYGGITKKIWKLNNNKESDANTILQKAEIPYFWIADVSKNPTGICTFSDTAEDAMDQLLLKYKSLLTKNNGNIQLSGTVGLFPCFTRGINHYGSENVESNAITKIYNNFNHNKQESTPPLRIYGMFVHGELGPATFADFTNEKNNRVECDQHGMTSILTVHTTTTTTTTTTN